MIVIHRGRGMGKTTDLIKISAETGAYIVTANHGSALIIQDMADNMKLAIPFPLTYQEFLDRRWYGKRIKGFLFDDVDRFLTNLTDGVPIFAVTITGERYEDRNH